MLFRTVRARWSVTVSVLFFVLMTGAGLAYAALPYAPGETLDPACHPGDANCTVQVFTAAGDLSGSSTHQTVIGLQGNPVASTTPTSSQVLQWNGSVWAPATLSTSTSTNYWSATSSGIYYNASGSVAVCITLPCPAKTGTVISPLLGVVTAGVANGALLRGAAATYVDQGLGIMYDWGMPTWNGAEDGSITSDASVFAPTGLDIDNWLDLAVSVNAKYVMLTTKWYDGFALWPTQMIVPANPVYGIAATAWYAGNGNPDIVGLFVAKARARNLSVGLYLNFHDSKWQALTGKTPAANASDYKAWIEGNIAELLTNYGPIDFLWIDGWSWTGYDAYLSYSDVLAYVKSIQPNCLLINNQHIHPSTKSEVNVYEVGETPPMMNTSPTYLWKSGAAEFADTITSNTKWFYDVTCTTRTAGDFVQRAAFTVPARYTYTVGIGIGRDGKVQPCQAIALQDGVAALRATATAYQIRRYPTPLSLRKTATASSMYSGSYPASSVTDGTYSPTNPTNNTWISDFATDQNPYVEIDLGSMRAISTVQIWNGPFASPGRLRDLTVTIYDATQTLVYTSDTLNALNVYGGGNASYTVGPPVVVNTGIAVSGRYVRVTRAGTALTGDGASLAIAEISVL